MRYVIIVCHSPLIHFSAYKKSLYSLHHAPYHCWYKLIASHLESPEIGLKGCPNKPCCFHGHLILGKDPLYMVLYVDDFIYFSPDPEVENYFESALKSKLTIDCMWNAEWLLGTRFDWSAASRGTYHSHLSWEAMRLWIVWVFGRLQSHLAWFCIILASQLTPFLRFTCQTVIVVFSLVNIKVGLEWWFG